MSRRRRRRMSIPIPGGGSSTGIRPPKIRFPEGSGVRLQNGTITVPSGETFDGENERFQFSGIGDGGQGEGQRPAFILNRGCTLRNVIIDPPAGDGVHCWPGGGEITLENVWWRDVGEDGLTAKNNGKITVIGGGARRAADKVFQLNAKGGFYLYDFYAEDCVRLVRTNGGKNAKDLAYKVSIKRLLTYDVDTILKMSNPKARGRVFDCDFVRSRRALDAQDGSRIESRRIRYWD
jgi:pectate lyase C